MELLPLLPLLEEPPVVVLPLPLEELPEELLLVELGALYHNSTAAVLFAHW